MPKAENKVYGIYFLLPKSPSWWLNSSRIYKTLRGAKCGLTAISKLNPTTKATYSIYALLDLPEGSNLPKVAPVQARRDFYPVNVYLSVKGGA